MSKKFSEFLKELEDIVKPLSRECNIAFFDAATTGKEEDYQKSEECQKKLEYIFADKEKFKYLESIKEDAKNFPDLEKRQFDKIYKMFLSNQIDKELLDELIKLQTEVEKKFATFRPEIDGKKVTDNELDDILEKTDDAEKAKVAWHKTKEVGKTVVGVVKKLAALRNKAAKDLGFKNFHEMSLILGDQNPEEIEKIFDELAPLTEKPYKELKNEIDSFMAKRFGISEAEIMPWHLGEKFLQRAPKIYSLDLDKFFKDKDVVKLTEEYYKKIGLPIEDIVAKSDLYEKEGKYQHACCLDVDREGDVRMICNVKNNQRWMATMLHEAGHAIYDKNIDPALPWFLKRPPHIFTTEAIAMMFERNATDPVWIKEWTGAAQEEVDTIREACKKTMRLEKLIFSRWSQVMYRFEKALYENPDQDLNKLWWDLVEKYQLVKKPEGRDKPDWAAKIHVSTSPAYYHNYELGELFAAQLKNYIKGNGFDETQMGIYLKDKVFSAGNRYEWNEMIEKATGEKLTAKYFVEEFVR